MPPDDHQQAMTGMTHDDALESLASERYLLGDMSELERHRFEEHFFACAECAADVRAGAVMREAATLAFAHESQPMAAATDTHDIRTNVLSWRQRWRPAALVPLAAAATFALMAGYQSMIVIPRLEGGFAAQALVPVVLRPAARGAESLIPIARDAAFVSLEPELIATPSADVLRYELRTEGDGAIVSGQAPRPTQGARLLLLVPARKLTQAGRYILTVHDGPVDGPLLGEFSLAIERR